MVTHRVGAYVCVVVVVVVHVVCGGACVGRVYVCVVAWGRVAYP